MSQRILNFVVALGAAALLGACGPQTTGSPAASNPASQSNAAVTTSCSYCLALGLDPAQVAANTDPATGDVTICHYPPGNRARAHTITVGQDAVPPHVKLHGDTIGPCGSGSGEDAGTGGGTGGGTDAGTGGSTGGAVDAGCGTSCT